MAANPPIEIGLLLYPHVQMAAVLGLSDLFEIANRFTQPKASPSPNSIRITHWATENRTDSPIRVSDSNPQGNTRPSVLVLPPSLAPPPSRETAIPLLPWLQKHHQQGCILASVCAGAFLLAETGLLEGRPATTHWNYAERFRERFPKIALDSDRLIIDDGDIVTAGGAMAWTDLGLKLVDRFLGSSIMIETAKVLLVDPPGREQSYYSVFSPRLMHGDSAILKSQHWLQETLAQDTSLERLAQISGLHPRTFQRRFTKATGMNPSAYCQRLRVSKACELLQFSDLTTESIAWEIGYQDPSAFRKVFHRIVGLTPGEYRRRFAPSRSPIPAD